MRVIRASLWLGLFGVALITLNGCDRSSYRALNRRVTTAIENGKYYDALHGVESRLANNATDTKLLAERVFLYFASADRRVRSQMVSAQREFEAAGGDRLALLSAAGESRLPTVRQNAAYVWGVLRDPAGLHCLKVLAQERNPEVRAEAVRALAKLADPSSYTLLLIHLRDKSWEVRAASAEALIRLGKPDALPNLLRSANDGDDYAKSKIREAITALASPSQVPLLRNQLDRGERPAKIAAALALGKLNDPAAVPFLMELIQDPKFDDRPAGARTLAEIGGDKVAPLFEKMLPTEADKWVKLSILKFFSNRNDAQAHRVLDEYRQRREESGQDLF